MTRTAYPILLLLSTALTLMSGCATLRHGPEFNPRAAKTESETTLALTNILNPALLKPGTNEFRLGPGDQIEIELIGRSDSATKALVGPDGMIYFDLLPGLCVWGLTPRETRDLIERDMGQYVTRPRVSVTLREVHSQRVWVVGRVSTPGIYSLSAPTTLVEAISRAGGLFTSGFTGTTEELADLYHSFVMRNGHYLPVDFKRLIHEGDMSQNIYLEPDDFVFLPSATSTEVYVIGAVNQPRPVAFKDQVTLSSAIATAGGFLPTAYPRQIVIVRGSLTEPHFAVVNFLDIVKGKATEVRLRPRDIVYVPDSPLQPFQKAGYLIVQTFVRTLAANQGLRAGGSVQNVSVNIPVSP